MGDGDALGSPGGTRDVDHPRRVLDADRDGYLVRAEIGIGRGKATVWTCDLTKEYVAINGDYRS